MQKLLTPTQYESALDRLNDIRPLQLAERIRPAISIPVLNSLPVESKKSISGVLAKGTQHGSLLNSMPVWADNTIETTLDITEAVPNVHYQFPIRVKGVLVTFMELAGGGGIDWSDKDFTAIIMDLCHTLFKFLPFVGTDIYFKSSGYGGYEFEIILIGFY